MKFLKTYPLLRLCLFFIAGIILAYEFDFRPTTVIVVCLLLLLSLCILSLIRLPYSKQWLFGFFCCCFFMTLGIARSNLFDQRNTPTHFSALEDNKQLIGIISEAIEIKERSVKVVLKITAAADSNSKISHCSGKLLLYLQKDSLACKLNYGDRLLIAAQPNIVEAPKNPEEFNYKRYLLFKNLFHQVYLPTTAWKKLSEGHGNKIKQLGLRWQQKCLEILATHGMSEQEFAVASAILVGQSEFLDKDLARVYQGAGVVHILCVSGLHVGLFAGALMKLLYFLKKRNWQRILRSIIVVAAIWLYAVITGLSPSVLRSAVMFSFVSIGQNLSRNSSIYNSLTTSALLLLFIQPSMLFAVGFQLSYLAVIGIVAFQKFFLAWFTPASKILGYFWELVSVSMAAQLVTAPLSIYYFHQFPNYFLLANIFASPLSVLIIPLGMVIVAGSFVSTWLANTAAFVLNVVISFLNFLMTWVESLPKSVAKNLYLSLPENILLYVIILLLLALISSRRKKYLPMILGGLLVWSCLVLQRNYNSLHQTELVIYHLNKQSLIQKIEGKKARFYTDSLLYAEPERYAFQTSNYGIKKRINRSECMYLITDSLSCIVFEQQLIRIIHPGNAKHKYEKQLATDYLLLHNNPRVSIEELLRYYQAKHIIIDGSNKAWQIQKWKAEQLPADVRLHITAEEGALIIKKSG